MKTLTIIKNLKTQNKYVGYVAGLQSDVPAGMPAVIPGENQDGFDFTEDMQIMSYELMYSQNNLITPKLWTKVFDYKIALTNENGFNNPEDPRANYITGENLDKDPPKLMKSIIMSWNFYRGVNLGNKLKMIPGIHAIDGNKSMPDIQTILNKNWYFEAVSNDAHHSPFPQGQGGKVLIPYILKWENYYPWDLFKVWNSNELPKVSI